MTINDVIIRMPRARSVVLLASAASTVAVVFWVLWYCRYGIDVTDESFYLVWIANPFAYPFSVSQFGFIYHPLFELVNGNVAWLRQANALLTFTLGWWVGYLLLGKVVGQAVMNAWPRCVVAAAFATAGLASLVFDGTWLATPSYNSLAFQALLIASAGFVMLADAMTSKSGRAGWLLVGTGGFLAFMAKPTTAIALAIWTLTYLLLAGRFSLRGLALAVAVAAGLLGAAAFAIDGSFTVFFGRLKGGLELAGTIGSGHTLAAVLRLEVLVLTRETWQALGATAIAVAAGAILGNGGARLLVLAACAMALALAAASMAAAHGMLLLPWPAGPLQAISLAAIPVAILLAGIVASLIRGWANPPRARWALAITLVTLPYAYAFGTSNNYWIFIGTAGVFSVFGGLAIAELMRVRSGEPVALVWVGLATQLIAVSILCAGLQSPYRQPQPLALNDYSIEVGRPGSILVLSRDFGRYYADFRGAATGAGFQPGTPMIDMSGLAPGVLYAIGAVNAGQAWMLGGYPGSNDLAVAALGKAPCAQLATAWLLVDDESRGALSPEVLASFGANRTTDYGPAGEFRTADGASGQKGVRTQRFLKPLRSASQARQACEAKRSGKP